MECKTVLHWINVSEKIPKNGEEVLCYNKIGFFVAVFNRYEARYLPGYYDFWDSGHCCGREYGDATHWMQLPEPPK